MKNIRKYLVDQENLWQLQTKYHLESFEKVSDLYLLK